MSVQWRHAHGTLGVHVGRARTALPAAGAHAEAVLPLAVDDEWASGAALLELHAHDDARVLPAERAPPARRGEPRPPRASSAPSAPSGAAQPEPLARRPLALPLLRHAPAPAATTGHARRRSREYEPHARCDLLHLIWASPGFTRAQHASYSHTWFFHLNRLQFQNKTYIT